MAHEVVFVGGPLHGQVRAFEEDVMDSPESREFPTMNSQTMVGGFARYERRAKADTPGRITYVFVPASQAEADHG